MNPNGIWEQNDKDFWIPRSLISNEKNLCDANNCFRKSNARVWFSKPDGSELSRHEGYAITANIPASAINASSQETLTFLRMMESIQSPSGYKYRVGDTLYFRDPTIALLDVDSSWTATASSGAGSATTARGALWLIKPFPGDNSENSHSSIHQQGFQGRGMWTGQTRMSKGGSEQEWLDIDFGKNTTIYELKIFRQCSDEYLERVPREFQVMSGGTYGKQDTQHTTHKSWSNFGDAVKLTKNTIMSDPPDCSRNRHRPGAGRSVDIKMYSKPFSGRYMRISMTGNWIGQLSGKSGFSFVGTNSGVQELEAIEFFRKMDCNTLAPSKAPTTTPTEFVSQSPSSIPTSMPTWYYQHGDFKDNITDLQDWVTRLDAQVQSQKKLIEYQTGIIVDLAAKAETSKESQADLDSKLDATRKLIRDAVMSMQKKLIDVDQDYNVPTSCFAAGVLESQCIPKVTADATQLKLAATAGDVTLNSHRCGPVSPCTSSLQISAIAEALAELKDI